MEYKANWRDLNTYFTKILNFSPPTQELAAKKVDRAIVLATVPQLMEVLAYLHEFRTQNPLLHSLVAKAVSVTYNASIARMRVSDPGYVVYIIYG